MSLRIQVINATQEAQFEHAAGPLEFGRGPQRDVPRFRVDDPTVSRDQLRIAALSDHRVRIENLSLKHAVLVAGAGDIGISQARELELPVAVQMGGTRVRIEAASPAGAVLGPLPQPVWPTAEGAKHVPLQTKITRRNAELAGDRLGLEGLVSIEPPTDYARRRPRLGLPDAAPSGPASAVLADWLETVIDLQQAAAGSPEFYQRTAQALMDLIGLDLGLVLLRQEGAWTMVGSAVDDDRVGIRYSQTLLNHILAERRTIYRDLSQFLTESASLVGVEAAVVAPIFGLHDDVVGALYGVRNQRNLVARGGIAPLEAQLVQLLAAAAGTHLARSLAVRTRVQFEQFFSPELVRELERDPHLLEGRSEEVTVLFSDLRGFTELSQRLGAAKTCRMVRDMMECLSERIVEHGGAIVDYAGDGILAMWNAPAKQPDHAARACRAALAMLGELPSLNARWRAEAAETLALGIGLNTGEAQVGNTGSSRKFKYGPHGHTVNLASRIQDATKKLGLPLLLADRTREQLPTNFQARRLGRVRLPGVKEPIVLHELHGEQADPSWLDQREVYERALALYEAGQWSQACQALSPLLSATDGPGHYDTPTLQLIRRALECLEARPEAFEPILEVSAK